MHNKQEKQQILHSIFWDPQTEDSQSANKNHDYTSSTALWKIERLFFISDKEEVSFVQSHWQFQ